MSVVETVSVGDVRIAVKIDGEPGRPWIVLSNSLAATYDSWDDQIALLARSYRVLRYDSRGHGQSSTPPGPYSFEDLTSDVVGLLDYYGISDATYLGLSMGGMTGLGLAINHPSRINKLICCDGRSDAIPPFVENWNARIASIGSGGMAEIAEFNKGRWFTPAFVEAHPEVIEKAIDMILATNPDGYIGCARALQGLDYKRHLDKISCPTLFVCGAQDMAAPATVMQEMAGLVKGARLDLVDPGAHVCNMENPAVFNEVIGKWLAQ